MTASIELPPELYARYQEVVTIHSSANKTEGSTEMTAEDLCLVFASSDMDHPYSYLSRFFSVEGIQLPSMNRLKGVMPKNRYTPTVGVALPFVETLKISSIPPLFRMVHDAYNVLIQSRAVIVKADYGKLARFLLAFVGAPADKYGIDMTAKALKGDYDKVMDSDDDHSKHYVNAMIDAITRFSSNNVIIVAEPGTGKTSLVQKLAYRISKGLAPSLTGSQIVDIDISSIISGTRYRGEFEEKFGAVIQFLSQNPSVIGFFDEIHTVMGAGKSSESNIDAVAMLKKPLLEGKMRIIGATTVDEFRTHIEKDEAFLRRFQIIHYREPDRDTVISILEAQAKRLTPHYGVRVERGMITSIVDLASTYIKHRYNPDKSLELLEQSMITAKKSTGITSDETTLLSLDHLRKSLGLMCNIVIPQDDNDSIDTTATATITTTAIATDSPSGGSGGSSIGIGTPSVPRLRTIHSQGTSSVFNNAFSFQTKSKVPPLINPGKKTDMMDYEQSGQSLATRYRLPLVSLKRLSTLSGFMEESIKGQSAAIEEITAAVATSQLFRKDNEKGPLTSILISGLSGTGKTLVCSKLSEYVLGKKECFLYLNMSDYKNPASLSSLIESPLSSTNNGKLSTHMKRYPYSVILLDEIEKSDTSIQDYFLSVLDNGYSYDSAGKQIDFSTSFIVMTSNIGADRFLRKYGDLLKEYRAVEYNASLQSNYEASLQNNYSVDTTLAAQVLLPTLVPTIQPLMQGVGIREGTQPTSSSTSITHTEATKRNRHTSDHDDEDHDGYPNSSKWDVTAEDFMSNMHRELVLLSEDGLSMRKEFRGRIKRIITYGIPTNSDLSSIIESYVQSTLSLIESNCSQIGKNISVRVEDSVALSRFIIARGYNDNEGIRSIHKYIGKHIHDSLSMSLVHNLRARAFVVGVNDWSVFVRALE